MAEVMQKTLDTCELIKRVGEETIEHGNMQVWVQGERGIVPLVGVSVTIMRDEIDCPVMILDPRKPESRREKYERMIGDAGPAMTAEGL